MRISDWSSDVCSSDLLSAGSRLSGGRRGALPFAVRRQRYERQHAGYVQSRVEDRDGRKWRGASLARRNLWARANPGGGAASRRQPRDARDHQDRNSVVSGTSVSVSGYRGGRHILKKKKTKTIKQQSQPH